MCRFQERDTFASSTLPWTLCGRCEQMREGGRQETSMILSRSRLPIAIPDAGQYAVSDASISSSDAVNQRPPSCLASTGSYCSQVTNVNR